MILEPRQSRQMIHIFHRAEASEQVMLENKLAFRFVNRHQTHCRHISIV